MLAAGGEDCNHQFTNVNSGSVYASAMVNVSSATTTGDYFIHFSDGGTYDFYARTFVIANGTGFNFGISKYNGVKAFESTVRTFGTTYLLVIKYNFGAGATNDNVQLFVNPALGGTEPAATVSSDLLLTDAANISGIFLRQGGAASAPGLQLDGIKVGTTWASVTSAAGCTLNLTAFFEAMYVAGGTAMPNPAPVTVSLYNASTFALVESKTGTLDVNGVGSFLFTSAVNGTSYFIQVKSPTSLETWSATGVSFTGGALSYNFTTALGKAYTDGSLPPQSLQGSKYCIYSGDVNHDGFITNDDFTGVDNDASVGDWHVENDVNGDGFVTNDDFTFIDNNASVGLARQVPPGAPSHLATRPVKNHVQRSSVN
jgi:hypothetical protein